MKNLKFALVIFFFTACKKNAENNPADGPKVNFIFKFDSTQARLNNIGEPSEIAPGNAAQSPVFNKMSAHYVELAPEPFTPLGQGKVLYRAPETAIMGANAIDFNRSVMAGNNEVFLSVPLSTITTGSYKWLRVSLAYQNYDIKFTSSGFNLTGTIASFIGFNTYIQQYKIKDSTVNVGDNKLQGYWGFETSAGGIGVVRTGQAPAGATTVPNPLFTTSPIPSGSCVVTGAFPTPLTISGSETQDINIVVSLSTNKSFEWHDHDGDGKFDPLNDHVVDMGIRGLLPYRQ